MCQCATEGRPCGLADRIRAAVEWFRARADEPADPTDRAGPPRKCSQCGDRLGRPEDAEALHDGWCYACDAEWFEANISRPIIRRLGRRGALRAFKRLARNVRELV